MMTGVQQEKNLNKRIYKFLLIPGLILILISLYLTYITYQRAKSVECRFPDGTELSHVPVGGLTAEEAKQRLVLVYDSPFLMQVENHQFAINPQSLGFSIDEEKMVQKGLELCEKQSTWFWFKQYLWNNYEDFSVSNELVWNLDGDVLQAFLSSEILPRYEIPGTPSYPLKGTTQFITGQQSKQINLPVLQDGLIDAYLSPQERIIEIPYEVGETNQLTNEMLIYQLNQVLMSQNFTGVVELQAERLSDNSIYHFTSNNLQPFSPDVAFTAASTMKIPILLSSLSRLDLPLSDLEQGWINYMIIYSENDPADRLMEEIDAVRGPLVVTEDMQNSLGLNNTFIAGYFYLGAPLLDLYQTPANQRSDLNLNADLYNQTTVADISTLLSWLYECEQNGRGPLITRLGENMTQEKCQLAVETLKRNQMGALIESGLPEATPIAHKHGWSEESDGLIHTFSDVGIVYAEENDFVLSIFIYSPNQLLFDTANLLTAELSQVVYNFMNPDYQIGWDFGL
ncbi:MAG: hypothetical protein CL609_15965 [Anaerolineaceae bacterium]|nr:hypothetical protein [Anaerolineaceae bacterium]